MNRFAGLVFALALPAAAIAQQWDYLADAELGGRRFAMPVQMTAAPIDDAGIADRVSTVYTGIPGPYSAFASAAGVMGFDDYSAAGESAPFLLDSLRFVGGTSAAGGQVRFEFYNPDASPAGSFTVALPTAGDSIWTITITPNIFVVPNAGFMQLNALTATGRWFFTSTAPTVGSNNIAVGTGSNLAPQRYNAFELKSVPEPASMALIALGALFLRGRRS